MGSVPRRLLPDGAEGVRRRPAGLLVGAVAVVLALTGAVSLSRIDRSQDSAIQTRAPAFRATTGAAQSPVDGDPAAEGAVQTSVPPAAASDPAARTTVARATATTISRVPPSSVVRGAAATVPASPGTVPTTVASLGPSVAAPAPPPFLGPLTAAPA